ncbi:MAG TPA: glycosyltransferase family 39 protein [Pyrinomonadaceae bacterium]
MSHADNSLRRRLGSVVRTRAFFWGALLTAAYLISRFDTVVNFPVFIDEAIHVDWARATAESYGVPDAGFDGKWLSIKLFALVTSLKVPLYKLTAARLSVVVLGLFTALAIYLIGRDLFSRRAGALGVALYVVTPFSLIYSSLAMTDGVQLAFGTWATFLSVRLARTQRWGYALLLPLALAAAILAKFSGLVLLGLPVAAVVLLAPRGRRVSAALRALPAVLTPLGLFALFYKLDLLGILKTKAAGTPRPLSEQVWANLATACEWLSGLLTPSVFVLALVAALWLLARERSRAGLFVLALLGIAVVPFVVISQVWYPRYLLGAVVPVSLMVGRLLDGVAALIERRWGNRRVLVAAAITVLVVVALAWPVQRSGAVMFTLPEADIPAAERFQFVDGWPSGYGVLGLVDFLRQQSEATPGGILVARTNWADHPLQSLNIYLTPSPSLTLHTLGDDNETSVAYLTSLNTKHRTLLVLSTDRGAVRHIKMPALPLLKCGKPVWSYTRPDGRTGFVVLELHCGDLSAPK